MTNPFSSRQAEKSSLTVAPPFPENFIPRPEHLNRLKPLLTQVQSSPTVVINSKDGLGGMGKTSLALAIAHDESIRQGFPDGILWATLGPTPDILDQLGHWLTLLDDQGLTASTISLASDELRHRVKRRRMLLVVDELWDLEDLVPFQVVTETDCRLLVTTRDVEIPDSLTYTLGEMNTPQALQLFETHLKQSLDHPYKRDALQFAKAVGYLPLSLFLGVSQISNGLSWSDLLTGIQHHVDPTPATTEKTSEADGSTFGLLPSLSTLQNLLNFGKNKELQQRARQACLIFCLEQLDPDLRLSLARLGLFHRNVTITPAMAALVWKVQEYEARQKLQSLKLRGFLTPGQIDAQQGQRYSLHPVIRDVAGWLMQLSVQAPLQGLGLSLTTAHQNFLEHYRPYLEAEAWHTIPQDGYIHSHLMWHLRQAGWQGEIHQLLQEITPEGRNAWHEVCDRLNLRTTFQVDLGRAWELAKEIYPAAPEYSIGLQVRYALTSSFARAQNLESHSTKRPLPTEIEDKAQAETENFAPRLWQEEWAVTKVLLNAAPFLPDLATKIIKSTAYPSNLDAKAKTDTIDELLNNLYQESPEMAVELTEHLLPQPSSIEALSRLVPKYPAFSLPLLRLLQSPGDDARLVQGIACLAASEDHKLHPDLLPLLPKLRHPLDRLFLLTQFQHCLPVIQQPKANSFRQECIRDLSARKQGLGHLPLTYGEILTPIHPCTQEFLELYDFSGWAIALCFAQAGSALIDEALQTVRQSRSEDKQSKALAFLLPKLSESQRDEIWQQRHQFDAPECRARILSALLPYRDDALEALLKVLKLFETPKKLDILCQSLPGPEALISEIFKVLEGASPIHDCWLYLDQILPHLPSHWTPQAAALIQDWSYSADGVRQVLKRLRPSQSAIAAGVIELIENIPPVYERAQAIQNAYPFLPEDARTQALEVALRIQFPYARLVALSNFIRDFPAVAPDALNALQNCPEESPDNGYELLIPQLPQAEREEAIALMQSIPNESSRLERLLRTLPYAPYLFEDLQTLVLENPELRQHCELPEIIHELYQICQADLSEANPHPAQTLNLIFGMLPLIHWAYSPQSQQTSNATSAQFCPLIQAYLAQTEAQIQAQDFSKLLDFFVEIPTEVDRVATLNQVLSEGVDPSTITPEVWLIWLEKLSRYQPHEFMTGLAGLLKSLMQFSNLNSLNQCLQAIRSVKTQWS